jgi:thioredoxin-related protein
VRFTPTIQFFPETLDGLAQLAPDKREVMRIPGYLRPDDFLDVFRFVRERAYETGTLRDFVKRRS